MPLPPLSDDRDRERERYGRPSDRNDKSLEHEYELIPISPLRNLERRLEDLERVNRAPPAVPQGQTGMVADMSDFYRDMVDAIRMNQQLVDELAKANDALRIELSRMTPRIEDMVGRLDELISFIKASANEELVAQPGPSIDAMKPLLDKMSEIVESNKKVVESNQAIAKSMDDMQNKMKRPAPPMMPPQGMMRRPPGQAPTSFMPQKQM